MFILLSEYRTVQIFAELDELSVYFVDDNGPINKWEGDWPNTRPPANTYLFTLNDVMRWWRTDFSTHPFTSTFANWLNHSRTTLKWGLPQLTSLILSHFDLNNNVEFLALFKETQVFTRLSISFDQWSQKRNAPLEYARYIRQAMSVHLHPCSTALRQIESLEKDKTSLVIPLPLSKRSKPSHRRPPARNFSGFARPGKPNRTGSDFKHLVKKCYFCGKQGHTQNVCRLKAAKGKNASAPVNTANKQ